jgi:hypothetical protein
LVDRLADGCARISNIKSEDRHHFPFPKGLWNQFNDTDFALILIPTLLGEAPSVPLERLCSWVMADDIQTHDIGVRAIRARYYREAAAWECLIEAFKSKPAEQLTLSLPIALAKLLGHDDIGYYSDEIPKDVRAPAIAKVLTFGTDEIAKLLSMLPDGDFERPSLGYSLLPLFGQRAESPHILPPFVITTPSILRFANLQVLFSTGTSATHIGGIFGAETPADGVDCSTSPVRRCARVIKVP